jgi:hypothetical protein
VAFLADSIASYGHRPFIVLQGQICENDGVMIETARAGRSAIRPRMTVRITPGRGRLAHSSARKSCATPTSARSTMARSRRRELRERDDAFSECQQIRDESLEPCGHTCKAVSRNGLAWSPRCPGAPRVAYPGQKEPVVGCVPELLPNRPSASPTLQR